MGEGENYGAETSPAGALAHALLSYKGEFLSHWPQRRGKRERYVCTYIYIYIDFFFFFLGVFPPSPFEQVPLYGEATLRSWGAVLRYALVCGLTDQPII